MNSLTKENVVSIPVAPRTAMKHSVALSMVGSGGDGVALLGDLILRMAARLGLYGIMVQSYGPQIRGGESAVTLRISDHEVQYEGDQTDLLLCFRLRDIQRFHGTMRLHRESVVILDQSETGELPAWLGRTDQETYRFPFAQFEDGVEVVGPPRNMLGLGILCHILGWPESVARQVLEERFPKKNERQVQNLAALAHGFAAPKLPSLPAPKGSGRELFAETGNEALARGAIDAGIRFFAGYPITPSSEVMETLIDELPLAGGRVVQAEDEIAALGMVVGASFGGVPSLTATSGPGLSLMTEMMGLSAMAEIPVVIIDCQRAGPATGMPSRTEQSDLYHAVYGGHGDFPRVVLGLYDVVHGRELMYRAVLLAEKYQLPVLVLSDAYIAQRRQIRDRVPASAAAPARLRFRGEGPSRFDLADEHGVNAFRVPGDAGGTYLAAGIEHTVDGYPTSDTAMHQRMNEKRFKKLAAIAEETGDWFRTLGDPSARQGVIAWGSQYGLLREFADANPHIRFFLPEIIHPFPLAALEEWRRGLDSLAVLELTYQGQFHRYLSGLTDLRGARSVSRSGGTPLTSTELNELLREVM
jgi:2-oxoglutarate/2-oxoacid ferredoxin oxidoreductase subunit alpha